MAKPNDPELAAIADMIDVDSHLDALAHESHLPALAVGACLLALDRAAPRLRDVINRAADGQDLETPDQRLLFRGLHILGGGQDPLAFPPLMRLLESPPERLEALLGDATTETLSQIVAGVFNGDVERLFQVATDPAVDMFARSSLLGAATFLTWDGRIPRECMKSFLIDFDAQTPTTGDDDHAWFGWQQAIAVLAFNDLVPLVEACAADGRFPDDVLSLDDFREDLAAAEQAPQDLARLKGLHLGYIDDVLEALERWGYWPDDDQAEASDQDWRSPLYEPQAPTINPFRGVGRNDPCPCGSGKKAKKCCLA